MKKLQGISAKKAFVNVDHIIKRNEELRKHSENVHKLVGQSKPRY